MEKNENLCKVETRDGDFYLFTQLLENERFGFDITITDGHHIWKANVTDDMLQNMAQKVEMNIKEYTTQTLNALTASTTGTDTFIYQAIQNGSTLEFSWKKQLNDGVKFQLGSISLSLSEENKILMKTILDFFIRKVNDYKDTMTTMKKETEQLARDRDVAIMHLNKCIVGKEEMEVDLFQKFVTVLNEKKAKIRRLQETIEQQSEKPVASNAACNVTENHPTNDQTRDDDGDDTDVEMDVSQNKNQTEEKATTSSNIGVDLFQDEEDTAPVIKRRRKQPSRQPVRTPSKPVLPEVKTTMKRTTSNVSNVSSTSTNSDESKQSSSSSTRRSRRKKASSTFPDDVEDLFGDMA